MLRRTLFSIIMVLIIALALTPILAFAGGDQNTNRGTQGEQIGEPLPEPFQDPQQPREGDPNPDMENVPNK